MKRSTRLFVLILIALTTARPSQAGDLKTANAMAPLQITNENQWNHFGQQLQIAKSMGIDAISSDVWWGLVESKGDQQFDWSYYDRLSDAIVDAGLKWVPILSFHSCGGNVGDVCDIPLPKWVWTKFSGLSEDDLKYRSEQDHVSREVVSLWADDQIVSQYRELMEAFKSHFAGKAQHILEINISCGPAGELRYPSYNQHDQGAGFPSRGALQCYGRLAKEDFRRWVIKKYGSLDKVNAAWGTRLMDPSQIDMPSDPNGFFGRKDYLNITYGKDLTTWLNGSLIAHGRRMIQTAQDTFDQAMKGVDIGIKIPGVHWRMTDPNMPRAAEVNAGLIPTSIDLNAEATAHGYQPIISSAAGFKGAPHRVVLHFTCLEMPNKPAAEAFSLAEALVFWVGQGAAAQGVPIKGENALPVTDDDGWNHIENVFTWSPYEGLTVLRIGEVTDNPLGRGRYEQFIKRFRRQPRPGPIATMSPQTQGLLMSEKPLAGKKVAVLVETEYIYDEIEYYRKRVPELGGELHLLSYLWGQPSKDFVNDIDSPNNPVTSVHRLTVDRCVTRTDPNDYDIVICAANYVAVRLREIPPMGSLGSPELTRTAPAVQFFARAMENSRIVKGAMCHALWILTPRPDLLKDRHVICHTVVLADIHNAGAVYIPAPNHVVVDKDLVTARSFADMDAFFDAIVTTVASAPPAIRASSHSTKDILNATVARVTGALETRFAGIPAGYGGSSRPVAKAARGLLDGTLNVAAEVKRITGVDLDTTCAAKHKPILLVASKFGTWASELTLVAATLLKAGYRVKIATEDGSPPHMIGPSIDPDFMDGAWRCSVVSPEERDLALSFLNPSSKARPLLKEEHILDLRRLAKPPQVGDYLKDHRLLGKYREALREAVELADEYDAIIIAGGSGAVPGFMDDRGLQSLILAFNNLRKPIMGECNGGLCIAQTVDPCTDKSILAGRAVTTHSWLDEYQSNWGWTQAFPQDTDSFWTNGKFDLKAYLHAEKWDTPGTSGNPLVDSEALFRNASGPDGVFFSPPGSPYSVVVDENLITCRTTPDGYPGVLALMAVLDGRPWLRGRLFIDADERGRRQPSRPGSTPSGCVGFSALDAARRGDLETLTRWLAEGGDPDVSDQDGWTPLLVAAARGHAAVVELLLWHDIPGARRANPDIRFPGADGLPIYLAGQSGDLATVKAILRARPGHVFEIATINGHTVLLQAAFYGQRQHQQLASFLLENIGDIVSIPKENGAAIATARKRLMTATNVRGQNPLALAQAYHIRPMINILKKFDSTTEDDRTSYYRRLLGRIAPPAPRNEEERQAQELTDRLIDAIQNALDHAERFSSGTTNLGTADDDALAAVDGLLNAPGLEINRLGGPLQRTPLIIACTGADTNERMRALRAKIVDRLIRHGADPLIHEVHAMGVNAVVRSAVWGHLYLLERFGTVLSPNILSDALNEKPLVNGFTALHDSVLRALSAQGQSLEEYLRQIEWLVQHGANYNIEDHSGLTQEAIARSALDDPDFRDNAHRVLSALLGNGSCI